MKFCVTKEHTFRDLEKFLLPAIQFGEEKLRKGTYDDWNEAEHTAAWLKKVLCSIQSGDDGNLTIYYLEEDGSIIGTAFTLTDSHITLDALAKDGIVPAPEKTTHLCCFHIAEAYRGKGRGSSWLTGEIFEDLRAQGVKQVYIKSSHHSALPLYERLGTKVGNYISISDSKLYQRYGHIFKVTL